MPTIIDLSNLDAPFSATCSPESTKYFKYVIKDDSDLEDLMILLNISQRSKLQIYLHWTHYPSVEKDAHDICLGDVPITAL